VSWLLVVFIPGLLILATFGLDRLEAGLDDNTISAEDIDAVLEQAKADCAKLEPRRANTQVYEDADEARDVFVFAYEEHALAEPARVLPVRAFVRHTPNPEFLPTREAHRV
jgi:hypothetical protein